MNKSLTILTKWRKKDFLTDFIWHILVKQEGEAWCIACLSTQFYFVPCITKMESKVYSISEIREILGVSRSKAYDYIKKVYEDKEPFRVVKVGNNYRIIRESFDKWLDGT